MGLKLVSNDVQTIKYLNNQEKTIKPNYTPRLHDNSETLFYGFEFWNDDCNAAVVTPKVNFAGLQGIKKCCIEPFTDYLKEQ